MALPSKLWDEGAGGGRWKEVSRPMGNDPVGGRRQFPPSDVLPFLLPLSFGVLPPLYRAHNGPKVGKAHLRPKPKERPQNKDIHESKGSLGPKKKAP